MRIGSYKVCQICNGPIVRGGMAIHNRTGMGFKKEGKPVHRYCFNKLAKDKIIKVKFNKQMCYSLI